ncbi:sterol-sensing domain of SREBP cleavage-activation-domain-containing protein [Dipodascopsis tothii]|uniref:sterol-sensing domain of SREBP cleavage-activation-domain-containing protein n=1 Tax=Dipodascopsis tothii TaxID=44089 RepID=UPI0034CE982C
MLWTIVLALLRGNKYATELSPSSRVYQLFERFAFKVVRNPQAFILWSAILTFVVSYPTLTMIARSGSTDVHQPWINYDSVSSPDICVKQAWVQGASDSALSTEVFELAFELQSRLTDGIRSDGAADTRSVVHSPLAYWDNSLPRFRRDADIGTTINSAADARRPRELFSGKKYAGRELVSADALIISLFYRAQADEIGARWDRNMRAILAAANNTFGNHPRSQQDAQKTSSLVYQVIPMSATGNVLLIGAYMSTLAYLICSLRCIHSVRSRNGLFIAFIAELFLSMTCTSTLLMILGVDFSMAPVQALPFIFVVVATENMFRLVNALLYTQPEQPATVRIGTALGRVGFLSMVTVGSNVALLAVPIIFGPEPIRQFCVFTATAMLVDFGLHMTYTVAVLSIDVRRLELEDLIHQGIDADADADESDDEEDNESWNPFPKIYDFFQHGSVPSTTTAGSTIMTCFLVAIYWHYTSDVSLVVLVKNLVQNNYSWADVVFKLRQAWHSGTRSFYGRDYLNTVINWHNFRDLYIGSDTFGQLVPQKDKYAIQLYEPVYFYLAGSRSARDYQVALRASTTNMFTVSYISEFVLVVTLVVVVTSAVLEYLLKDIRDEHSSDPLASRETVFFVKDLSGHHRLDVARISTSSTGLVVTVGLDHKVLIWQANARSSQRPAKVPLPADAWPVTATFLDAQASVLCIASRDGCLRCWSIALARFLWTVELPELQAAAPLLAIFVADHAQSAIANESAVVVCRSGRLYAVSEDGAVTTCVVSEAPLVSVEKMFVPRLPKRLVAAAADGGVKVAFLTGGAWLAQPLGLRFGAFELAARANGKQPAPGPKPLLPLVTGELALNGRPATPRAEPGPRQPYCLIPLAQLGMVLRARSVTVELIDIQTGTVVKVLHIGQYRKGSLRAFHDPPQHCNFCGCYTIATMCIIYSERDSGMLIMHSYNNPNKARHSICLRVERDPREKRCVGFEAVIEKQHWLDDAGGWEVTDINMVMGLRRKDDAVVGRASPPPDGLRQRRGRPDPAPEPAPDDRWEGWTMAMDGAVSTFRLRSSEDAKDSKRKTRAADGLSAFAAPAARHARLLVSSLGPVAKLGHRSIAVGFGNAVEILYFESEEVIRSDEAEEDVSLAFASRRRRSRRPDSSSGMSRAFIGSSVRSNVLYPG